MKHILSFIFVISSAVIFAQSDVLDLDFSGDGKYDAQINLISPPAPVITQDNELIYVLMPALGLAYKQIELKLNEDGSPDESIGLAGVSRCCRNKIYYTIASNPKYNINLIPQIVLNDGPDVLPGWYPIPADSYCRRTDAFR